MRARVGEMSTSKGRAARMARSRIVAATTIARDRVSDMSGRVGAASRARAQGSDRRDRETISATEEVFMHERRRTWIELGIACCALASGCSATDGFFCAGGDCTWSPTERARIEALADMPAAAPVDTSNRYAADPDTAALGKMFYFDTRFSGPSTALDALNRKMPFGRAPVGESAGVACVTCHDAGHASVDPASAPGNVSVGAGWTYNNALPTYDSAFYELHLWNGRADSLWSQAVADNENALTTNGNRLQTAWVIADLYPDAYDKVFADTPLPLSGPSSNVRALVGADGQCAPNGGACPAGCRAASSPTTGATGCWPRFPLQGKPGKVPGCQPGNASEPFGDAWDCMDAADQAALTRVLVNFGKAIAAYEATLVLGAAPFDRWVADLRAGKGDESTAISGPAKNGAHLFVGKAGCSDCHGTPLLSDGEFHNVGVGQIGAAVPTEADCPAGGVCDCAPVSSTHMGGPKNCLPWGARDGAQKLKGNAFRRDSMWSDQPPGDPQGDASAAIVALPDLSTIPVGAYRTPSLRNVALTAPYMHDGSIATLADVVWHYNQGVPAPNTPGVQAAPFQPLYLSADEQEALVEFLEALTCDPPPADVVAPPTLP
jgi:cytochrome c peroxidase